MKLRFVGRLLCAAGLTAMLVLVAAGPTAANHLVPQGGSPFRVPLVPFYKGCGAPNTVSGAPLAIPSCQPPSYGSANLQIGTFNVNGAPAQSVGYFRVQAIAGDANFQFSLKDVRCLPPTAASVCTPANSADGPDYIGELEATFNATITSHNYPSAFLAGTTIPIAFPVTIPCASTANTIGSTCSITTTYNTLIPGVIGSGPNHRAVWEYSQVQVRDGGNDGVVATAPNGLFMTQGMFFP
jgi:hypothetical protein